MRYTKEELIEFVQKATSITDLIKRVLKIKYNAHNRQLLKVLIVEYEISINHWNNIYEYRKTKKPKNPKQGKAHGSYIHSLVFEYYQKPYICENCGCDGNWYNNPLTLEIHHIDGDRKNNDISNLQVLCPNCHSQTPSFRKRKYLKNTIVQTIEEKQTKAIKKLKSIKYYRCIDCNQPLIHQKSKKCKKCFSLSQRKVTRPDIATLTEELKNTPMTQIGKKYGVTDNSIRKWAKYYNIKLPAKRKTSSIGKEMNHG